MAVFKGSAVAIVTPMKENGDINYDKLAELIDEQIEAGTDAIVICGTTGESSTLSHQEHLDAIRFCVKHTAGRVPVIAGTGSNSTKEAVYMSEEAEKSGADALLLVTPYYNKATQKGLIRHYTMIAESVSLPIIMYNVPSRTGCNIQPATAAYLVKHVKNEKMVQLFTQMYGESRVEENAKRYQMVAEGFAREFGDREFEFFSAPGRTEIGSSRKPMS